MSHDTTDDKARICLEFILGQLKQQRQEQRLLVVGLNGIQGSGKTTLVSTLAEKLRHPPYSLPTMALSIDDLYLPRSKQVELASQHLQNRLIQHRGQPSTHDIELGLSLLADLQKGQQVTIPAYDKSAFDGLGDRLPQDQWEAVNRPGQSPVRIVIVEGWCVGFRPLSAVELKHKWDSAVAQTDQKGYQGQLGYTRHADVDYINDALKSYDQLTSQFDAMIHIDAEDTTHVYQWRLEQEVALRKLKGQGMTEEQVIQFVNGYYPAYELYIDKLRTDISASSWQAQLRLVIGRDRRLKEVFCT